MIRYPDGTWIQPEGAALAPSGFRRKALARIGRSEQTRIVRIGAREAFGAYPARLRTNGQNVKGTVFVKRDGVVFHPEPFRES